MNTVIDYIGSMIIGGIILLSLLAALIYQSEQGQQATLELMAQEQTNSIYEIINFDFSKVGYGTTPMNAVLTADSNAFAFLGDIDDNEVLDTVRYYCGTKTDLEMTENPNDFPVFRRINTSEPTAFGVGVTLFRFRYFDSGGTETTLLSSIKGIESELLVQSQEPLGDGLYSGAYTKVKFYPMNLQ